MIAGDRCEGASAADLVSPATAFYFTMADEEVEEGVSTMAVDGESAQSKNAAKKARQKAA